MLKRKVNNIGNIFRLCWGNFSDLKAGITRFIAAQSILHIESEQFNLWFQLLNSNKK